MIEFSELMALYIMTVGVHLNFWLLSTIKVDNRSFQSQLKYGRRCTSCQLSDFTTVDCRGNSNLEEALLHTSYQK